MKDEQRQAENLEVYVYCTIAVVLSMIAIGCTAIVACVGWQSERDRREIQSPETTSSQIERRLDERLDRLERRVADTLPVLEFRVGILEREGDE